MKKKAMAAVLMMSMVVGSSLTVCAAPETKADGTVFDAEYYAQMYPDVVAELGTSADAMYQHYVTFGKAEGRLAVSPDAAIPQPENNEFDAVFYAQMYPDVVAALGTDADVLYQHYVTFGKAEGRLAYASFAAIQQPVSIQQSVPTQQQNSYEIVVWHNGDPVEKAYVRTAPDAPWDILTSEPWYDAEGIGWDETNWGSYIGIKKIINGKEHIMELDNVAPGMNWSTVIIAGTDTQYNEYRLWDGYSEGKTPSGAVLFSGNDEIGTLEWYE